MSIEITPISGDFGYCCDSGVLDRYELPFFHIYQHADYSDEALCKDIEKTLKYLFKVFPAPKKLLLRVKDVETGEFKTNIVNILKDIKDWGLFDLEIEAFSGY